jgi:hypothetical protein
MASIRQSGRVAASPEHVGSALRAFGAVHTRLAPGFVVATTMDTPTSRIVTFFDGRTARELLVTCDDTERRLVYSVVGGRLTHHNASAQVFAEGEGYCRFVWSADLLPDEFSAAVDAMMATGLAAMKNALEATA